jgi:hypothetical protein
VVGDKLRLLFCATQDHSSYDNCLSKRLCVIKMLIVIVFYLNIILRANFYTCTGIRDWLDATPPENLTPKPHPGLLA